MNSSIEAWLGETTGIRGQRPPADLVPYAARLYERRSEGVIVPVGSLGDSKWQPAFNQCHINVTTLCGVNRRYRPVRGWVYFAFGNQVSFVRFTAHSVVMDEEGKLWDITPSRAAYRYPFIRAEGTEEEFKQIVEVRGLGDLDHYK